MSLDLSSSGKFFSATAKGGSFYPQTTSNSLMLGGAGVIGNKKKLSPLSP